MNFRARMALVFTLLVGVLLGLFGLFVHARAEALRKAEFFERLEERALLVEQLIEESRQLPVSEAEHLADVLRDALPNEAILVIGVDGTVVFKRAADGLEVPLSWRETASRLGRVRVSQGERQSVVIDTPEALRYGIRYTMASAIDAQGLASMRSLRRSLLIGILIALAITAVLAWLYATWALIPVRMLIARVSAIREPSERLDTAEDRRPDEIGAIAVAFNDLLARLDDAFATQRSFIATASHELRTPLTVVRGELHQARNAAQDNDAVTAHLRRMEEQVLLMQDLLGQLLWLAQTQAVGERLVNDVVRLDEVAERAMERCRMRYPEVAIHFDMHVAEEASDFTVKGNAVLLTAAVYNLLSNAAKYGGGGTVRLVLSSGPEAVMVRVHDQGPGMDAETLRRARELFFRGAQKEITDGHGIGLSLVDRIARVHGGAVAISSGPSEGTTVELSLPHRAA
jgi:signal transduction histidine kinase